MKRLGNLFARYRQALLVAFLISLLIATISWLIDGIYEDSILSLQTLSSVASLLTSLLLFGAAWSLHQRHSASQQTTDKKAEQVFRLINLLQSVNLTIRYSENTTHGREVFNIRPTLDKKKGSVNKAIFKSKEIENSHYFHKDIISLYQDIVNLSTDIFMPKDIANTIQKKLDIKDMFALQDIKYEDVKVDDLVLYVSRIPNSNFALYGDLVDERQQTPKKVVSRYNDMDVNIDTLMNDLLQIHKKAVKWLKANSPYVLDDLNINKQ